MTDTFRTLCGELVQQLDDALDFTVSSETRRHMKALVARARAALAQSEPAAPTDEALIAAARVAVDTYPRVSELPYFLDPDSSEYEPMLLALHAAASLGRPILTPIPVSEQPPSPEQSDHTLKTIREKTPRYRVSVIVSTHDSAIDTRMSVIWSVLEPSSEILESVSLPEQLPPLGNG